MPKTHGAARAECAVAGPGAASVSGEGAERADGAPPRLQPRPSRRKQRPTHPARRKRGTVRCLGRRAGELDEDLLATGPGKDEETPVGSLGYRRKRGAGEAARRESPNPRLEAPFPRRPRQFKEIDTARRRRVFMRQCAGSGRHPVEAQQQRQTRYPRVRRRAAPPEPAAPGTRFLHDRAPRADVRT